MKNNSFSSPDNFQNFILSIFIKSMNRLLIIFVKQLIPGQVKTRLAKSIGNEKALAVYKKLLLHTREVALSCNAEGCVAYSGPVENNDIWEDSLFIKIRQRGDDLGARMHMAFNDMFQRQYDHVCLIGSDIFELTSSLIDEAFEALNVHDLVIGPAKDGGYYLIGMKKPGNILFENIPWGSDTVLSRTIERVNEAGLSYFLTTELNDIDDLDDIRDQDKVFLLG